MPNKDSRTCCTSGLGPLPKLAKGESKREKTRLTEHIKRQDRDNKRHCYSSAYCTGKTNIRYADYFSLFSTSKSIFLDSPQTAFILPSFQWTSYITQNKMLYTSSSKTLHEGMHPLWPVLWCRLTSKSSIFHSETELKEEVGKIFRDFT